MIFGDGILDALDKTGFRDVGPSAVLGHEMAHHVQYEDNLFVTDLTGPEATRRTELMADAFGTYFVTHKRGLALNTARVIEAEQNFYNVGDCSFDNPGHHGTPLQRLAAATWGAGVAKAASNQGHVLPSLTLDALFEKAAAGARGARRRLSRAPPPSRAGMPLGLGRLSVGLLSGHGTVGTRGDAAPGQRRQRRPEGAGAAVPGDGRSARPGRRARLRQRPQPRRLSGRGRRGRGGRAVRCRLAAVGGAPRGLSRCRSCAGASTGSTSTCPTRASTPC